MQPLGVPERRMVASFRTSVLHLPEFPAADLAATAEATERLGYDALWLPDERFFPEVYSSLTYCASRTERLKLGVCVADPYTRHPALTATAIATVDELSGGRALLGFGAGGSGFSELGLERRKPARAIAEAIQVVRGLLRSEQVSLEGEVVRFKEGKLDFRPRRADVPIYVASQNALGLQTAGQYADGAIMQGCLSESMLRFFFDQVATGAARAGRPAETVEHVARIDVIISDDRTAALDAARSAVATSLLFQKPTFTSFVQAGIEVPASLREQIAPIGPSRDPEIVGPIARHVPDEWVAAFVIAGDPDGVAEQVVRLLRRGIQHFMFKPVAIDGDRLRTVRQFAEEVLPMVRRGLATQGG